MPVETIRWKQDNVRIIDQTQLPEKLKYIAIKNEKQMWKAIRTLQIRGAPAIGIAAAFGLYLGVRNSKAKTSKSLLREVKKISKYLASARPTAINLFWALKRIEKLVETNLEKNPDKIKQLILNEAINMIHEDDHVCKTMGDFGASLLNDGNVVLTHCNAGGLATASYGTALAVIYRAHEQGKRLRVFVDETRPLFQGARLTAWELKHNKIPATLICDNMAATVMAKGMVDAVLVGADRITACGDFANKIGTYNLAVLAKRHKIPFYVVAPLSSFDVSLTSGNNIPIEERPADEIVYIQGKRLAPTGIKTFNPAFDVTPAKLVTAIITEKGALRHPLKSAIRALFPDSLKRPKHLK
jgi:methylthioribose-1-phosphate isomerase